MQQILLERSSIMKNVMDFNLTGIAKKICAVCLVFYLSVLPALPKEADSVIPPNNWGAVESLPKGTTLSVRMTSHDKMEGTFQGLDAGSIHLMTNGQESVFPRDGIAEIKQLGVPDSKLNGTLIGLGAGALAGGIAAGITGAPLNHNEDNWGILFLAAGIGIGTILGFTTDTLIKGSRLLYRK
jgi:hypothetical protein